MRRSRDPESGTLVLALAAALLWPLAAGESAAASCADLIFREGFEIGDTSRWSNSADPARADGTWTFSLDFDGTTRAFALELVERPVGSVTGYLLGGTHARVLTAGSVAGSTVTLEFEFTNPSTTRTIAISGVLDGATITGSASGDVTTQPVTLLRTDCELFEQRLVTAVDSGQPDPDHVRVLSAVVDGDGAFVAGGFVGLEDCDLWACDGGLTSYTEVGDVINVGLETDGGCSAGSSFSVTWNPGDIYSGTYSFTDCGGTTTGDLLAATSMGTTSYEAREVLSARLTVADALEEGTPLTGPVDGVSPSFLHFGKDEPALRAELNNEMSSYTGIEVDVAGVREVFTRVHPRAFSDLVEDFGLKVAESRSGIPMGGGARETYRDTGARPVIDDFGLVALESGRWMISGNQVPGLDLPFAYTIPPGGSRLEAPTPGGTVWVSLGPYGVHFFPLSGDPSGEGKANLVGFLAEDDSDMEELVGDGDGIRDPGEVWGFPIGGDPTGDALRLRRPFYIAPADGAVSRVVFEAGPSSIYFDSEVQWKVEILLPGRVRYAIGHVGKIATPLRDLVLAATGVDTDTFSGPAGTDLLAGFDPIPVPAGTELCLPQIVAGAVPGFPGYWVGEGSFLEWPWAQIEYQVPYSIAPDQGGDSCTYRFFTPGRRAELQTVMDADMLDLESQRYRDREYYDRWHWSAQGGLCQAENMLPWDFSDLYTRLGGWFERIEPATTADELFTFVPIDRSAAVYDPGNYDSAMVAHLVIRHLHPGPYSWLMPDGLTADVYLAVGEVLERTSDAMLVKWRDLDPTHPVVYQRLAFRLDDDGLTIKWGDFASTPGGASLPVLLSDDPCDDTTVLCYDHHLGAWPP